MEMLDPKMMTMISSQEEAAMADEEEEVALPGFRFHPTDEELVSFYLKRKVEKKPLSFEIIKQIDIYKYDPWDLPRSVGDKEWYFYCKRGRKYKNSVRPNRVTGSGGFWKATGIDRPIYDPAGVVVGLKKSLVYYRGSAGKSTKTDWMMHEFRLPSQPLSSASSNSQLPEAEIWTLCRILKRSRKHTPDWREHSSRRVSITTKNSTSISSAQSNNTNERYISFNCPSTTIQPHQRRQHFDDHDIKHARQQNVEQMILESENMVDYSSSNVNPSNIYHDMKGQWASPLMDHQTNNPLELASNFSSPLNTSSSVNDQDQVDDGSFWEDLSSVVEFAMRELYD